MTETNVPPSLLDAFESLCHSAQTIVGFHVHARGQPDVLGHNRRMLYGPLGRKAARLFGELIGDVELRQIYAALLQQLDRLASHDEEMVDWLANYLNMPAPNNDKDLRRLNRAVDREFSNAAKLVGPMPWLREPDYQALGAKSIEILLVIQDIELQFRKRFEEMQPGESAKRKMGYYRHSEPLVPLFWQDGTYLKQLQNWSLLPRPLKHKKPTSD